MNKNAIRAGLISLGFISISTQIYLLRESYMVFYGNELTLGIMLSAWMFLTGAGAWLGRFYNRIRKPAGFVLFLMLLLSSLPVLMMVKLNLYRAMVLPPGVLAGLNDVVYAAFLVQFPFCLINGFLFAALSNMLGKPGYAYSLESMGSLVSGIIVNFILLWLLPSRQSILLLTGCYLAGVVFFSFHMGRKSYALITVLCSLVIMALLSSVDVRGVSYMALYPGQTVVEEKESPFGQLVVTRSSGQLNCYENGLLLFSSGDEINNEENVHYAMIQHPAPRRVLLVSGGLSGAINEILKYHPLTIDYVELNPALLCLNSRSLKRLEKKGVYVHQGDARRFVQNSSAVYDVVLVLLPPPSSLQLNRLYTADFLKELKRRLPPDGIVSYSLPTTSDYVSRAGEGLNSVLYATLKEIFKYVLLVPGGKTYFIASDRELSLDIPGMIERKGISTSYVNKYYLDASQMNERARYMKANLSEKAGINHDFRPQMFFAQLTYRMTYFNRQLIAGLIILLLIVIVMLLNLNAVNAGLFTGGFTAGAFQVLIILTMQIYCGYVFRLTGFIIMLFMLGLAIGSMAGAKWFGRFPFRIYLSVQLLLAGLCVFIPLVITGVGSRSLPIWTVQLTAAMITLLVSFLTGLQYPLSLRLTLGEPSSGLAKNYSADLFGSALGAFIMPVLFFPLLGLMNTAYILALLNTAGAAILFIRRKNVVPL